MNWAIMGVYDNNHLCCLSCDVRPCLLYYVFIHEVIITSFFNILYFYYYRINKYIQLHCTSMKIGSDLTLNCACIIYFSEDTQTFYKWHQNENTHGRGCLRHDEQCVIAVICLLNSVEISELNIHWPKHLTYSQWCPCADINMSEKFTTLTSEELITKINVF